MDSVCKAELNQAFKRPDGAIIRGGSLYQIGNQLNNMAFSISELSCDKEYLGFALKLSEQTLRYNYPPYIDTYAQILYKLGGRKDAIDWQQKAIDLSDSLHQPSNQLKEVLVKIKNGSL
jgi:tetratricopeptide (TPR) repeat protein